MLTRERRNVIKRSLKSIRIDLKLEQSDMAKRLNISKSSYQKKETGKAPLLARELSKISKMSRISMDDIEILN